METLEYPSDGKSIQARVVKPARFDGAGRYPLLLDIQDDPRAMCGVEFALRAQIFAARGFVVLCANVRGTPGFGEQFGALLPSRLPGDDYDDLMRGVDFLLGKGYIDPKKMMVARRAAGGVDHRAHRPFRGGGGAAAGGELGHQYRAGAGRNAAGSGLDGVDAVGRSGSVREEVADIFREEFQDADFDSCAGGRRGKRGVVLCAAGKKSEHGTGATRE